ncbi:MAG: type II secretion system protein [Deltaproteobacteria bacterium]|nr:type II secretion system protein [Deltaproteobacteria bacterium]
MKKHKYPAGKKPKVSSQSGFTMIAVFLIMIAMVGAASTVLLSTRNNIRGAGQVREKVVSKYVAEAGVAYAKAIVLARWSSTTKWGDVLTTPPPEAGVYRDFTYGGTGGTPLVKARYYFLAQNNTDDPSMVATTDQDGKITLKVWGEILDPGSTSPIVMSSSYIEVQIYKEDGGFKTMGYTAQSHGGSTQSGINTFDANSVDFTKSTSF